MDLIEQEKYLVHNNFFTVFNKLYIDALVEMTHTHTTHRMDDGKRYYFSCPASDCDIDSGDIYKDNLIISVDQWSIDQKVFKDADSFLRFSLEESIRCNIIIDEYVNKLIETSQNKFPEKWI